MGVGKMSIFGGINDSGMIKDSGLALYEKKEADYRPDIFLPADACNPNQPVWQRLRPEFPYLAIRYPNNPSLRMIFQATPYRVENIKTGQWAVAWLVDWGPAETTGRICDMSPGLARVLRLETDDQISVRTL
jgi:hypothetical protein